MPDPRTGVEVADGVAVGDAIAVGVAPAGGDATWVGVGVSGGRVAVEEGVGETPFVGVATGVAVRVGSAAG